MFDMLLRFVFAGFGLSMACAFTLFGLFFLSWVLTRGHNGWDR